MSFPRNPFTPGAGKIPAVMGRRVQIEGQLQDILKRLRSSEPKSHMAFLYGPRGNGKTVLLYWMILQAEREPGQGEKRITVLDLTPQDVKSRDDLSDRIKGAGHRWLPSWWTQSPKIGATGWGFGVSYASGSDKTLRALRSWLARSKNPVLVTLDEAHEANPDVLGEILNAVQHAGLRRPVAVVFAGTPGLAYILSRAHATFWSRERKLPVGLLSPEAAQEVISEPFLSAGLKVDPAALMALAEAADRYPYFLQLYGEAAWKVVEASGGRALSPEHVPLAKQAASRRRNSYYVDRYGEFENNDLELLARDVALEFRKRGGELNPTQLNHLLKNHDGEKAELREFLVSVGYIWRDQEDSTTWTPGIPSLMEFMIDMTPGENIRAKELMPEEDTRST